MIETIIGAFIGAIITIVIAEIYHRRTSESTNRILIDFRQNNTELKSLIENLEEWQKVSTGLINDIHEESVKGTDKDPNFPYK